MRFNRLVHVASKLVRVFSNCAPLSAINWTARTVLGSKTPIRMTVCRQSLYIRPATPDLDVALDCFSGEYDQVLEAVPETRHHLIIDAGGYIGTSARVFAEKFPEARVVVIEPSSANYDMLVRNTAEFANITTIKAALTAERAGPVALRDRKTGEWGLSIVPGADNAEPWEALETVDTISFEDILERHHAAGCDILKVDIEGAEYELFLHGGAIVGKSDAIAIELHDRIVPGCTAAFERSTTGRRNAECGDEKVLSLRMN